MNFGEEIREEENLVKTVFRKFKTKDFSGTTGQAMKNSTYQLTQNIIFKFGSLAFTIIIARLLLPDRMGLYNLALATIVLFSSFSDLGISSALITFGAKMVGLKRQGKAKGYLKKLFKWKLRLVFITSGILIASAYFISEYYYQKPIFYALLVGALYIPIVGLIGFIEQIFKVEENFRVPLYKEILFQISRLIIVPAGILFFLKFGLSERGMVFMTLLLFVSAYAVTLLFLAIKGRKQIRFLDAKTEELEFGEIVDLKKFIYPLTATAMAGLFFGYIDTLMLGHFVSGSFIAYYGAAFSLVGGASAIIGFISLAVLPIFAKKNGKALEGIFRKSRDMTIFLSLLAGVFTYFVAYYVVKFAYGVEYLNTVPILKYFSILVVLLPIIGIYEGYFTTQKKTKKLATLLVTSAILNIIFNVFGILYGLKVAGEMGAVFGAVFATILSRFIYLVGLVRFRRKGV